MLIYAFENSLYVIIIVVICHPWPTELIEGQQYDIHLWSPSSSQCVALAHISCSVNDYRNVKLAKNKTPDKCWGAQDLLVHALWAMVHQGDANNKC